MRRIELLDTTLREGEQTPGIVYTLEDKLAIARALDDFGIDVLEVGHPAVAPSIKAHAEALCAEGLTCQTLAHARAVPADIELAAASGADWVGIFFSVSDAALEQRFRRSREDAIAMITDTIALAKDHGLQVRYTPEDTVRTPIETVLAVAQAACEAGADRISVADTAGAMTPARMHGFVAQLVAALPVPVNVHCHNDLGMAVANSLAAIEAGATTVDVTVNGIGERCGITSLAPLATALVVHELAEPRWRLERLPGLAQLVADASGQTLPVNAPIVGQHAFTHNAGLHVAAVLQDPRHYEFIPASLVGRERHIELDMFSGRAAVAYRLEALGLQATPEQVDQVLHVVKGLESRGLSDDDLQRLVRTLELASAAPAGGVVR